MSDTYTDEMVEELAKPAAQVLYESLVDTREGDPDEEDDDLRLPQWGELTLEEQRRYKTVTDALIQRLNLVDTACSHLMDELVDTSNSECLTKLQTLLEK